MLTPAEVALFAGFAPLAPVTVAFCAGWCEVWFWTEDD